MEMAQRLCLVYPATIAIWPALLEGFWVKSASDLIGQNALCVKIVIGFDIIWIVPKASYSLWLNAKLLNQNFANWRFIIEVLAIPY